MVISSVSFIMETDMASVMTLALRAAAKSEVKGVES